MNDVEKLLNTHINTVTTKNNYKIINTDNGKYIVKEHCDLSKIYTFLDNHNVSFYNKPIVSNEKYDIFPFVEEINTNKSMKANDLIILLATVHKKTCFYKDINSKRILMFYEKTKKQLNYLSFYYEKLSDYFEEYIYYLPSVNYYLYNSSTIFYSINLCNKLLKKYYDLSTNIHSERNVIVNNNISLNNYYKSNIDIIDDWSKSSYDIPINDLVFFFKNNPQYINLIDVYESIFQLTTLERLELIISLLTPDKISFKDYELKNTINIKNLITRLNNTISIYLENEQENKKEQET